MAEDTQKSKLPSWDAFKPPEFSGETFYDFLDRRILEEKQAKEKRFPESEPIPSPFPKAPEWMHQRPPPTIHELQMEIDLKQPRVPRRSGLKPKKRRGGPVEDELRYITEMPVWLLRASWGFLPNTIRAAIRAREGQPASENLEQWKKDVVPQAASPLMRDRLGQEPLE